MFGKYKIPFDIEQEDLRIRFESREGSVLYTRDCRGETRERILMVKSGEVTVHPVEPVNTPRAISTSLLIELATPLAIEPNGTHTVYLTFPLEAGIFMAEKGGQEMMDVVSLVSPKLTLYGNPRSGILCKHWKSDLYAGPPPSGFREGRLKLTVRNTLPKWMEITRAVFNAYGMKLFFSARYVGMTASMRILGKNLAETDFEDKPMEKGMTRALERYAIRIISVAGRKFVMEGDL